MHPSEATGTKGWNTRENVKNGLAQVLSYPRGVGMGVCRLEQENTEGGQTTKGEAQQNTLSVSTSDIKKNL